MARISIRDTAGNLLNNIDLGTLNKGDTSTSVTFRVYNDYEQLGNTLPAYNVKVGLVVFKDSKVVTAFSKSLESYIIKNGHIEIDCTISSKMNGGYPNVDWTPIKMVNYNEGWFYGEEFDIIYPNAPNNFNEYKIRLSNFPSENYFKGGEYKIFIKVIWSDKE